MTSHNHHSGDLTLLWGAENIARELGVSIREAFYLLQTGRIPGKKVGRRWCASRHGLRQHFADVLNEQGSRASAA